VIKRVATGRAYIITPANCHSQNLLLLRVALTALHKFIVSQKATEVLKIFSSDDKFTVF